MPAAESGIASWHTGALAGIYMLFIFLFAPLWGRVSDRIGRRPVILVGLVGYAATLVLFAFSNSMSFAYGSARASRCIRFRSGAGRLGFCQRNHIRRKTGAPPGVAGCFQSRRVSRRSRHERRVRTVRQGPGCDRSMVRGRDCLAPVCNRRARADRGDWGISAAASQRSTRLARKALGDSEM